MNNSKSSGQHVYAARVSLGKLGRLQKLGTVERVASFDFSS
jgi:hypothetical protein